MSEAGSFGEFEREVVRRSLAEMDAGRYAGHQIADLERAFDLVKPAGDWKDPIDAVVPLDADTSLIDAAVSFYTGGMAEVIPVTRRGRQTGWRVLSGGYYANIGS